MTTAPPFVSGATRPTDTLCTYRTPPLHRPLLAEPPKNAVNGLRQEKSATRLSSSVTYSPHQDALHSLNHDALHLVPLGRPSPCPIKTHLACPTKTLFTLPYQDALHLALSRRSSPCRTKTLFTLPHQDALHLRDLAAPLSPRADVSPDTAPASLRDQQLSRSRPSQETHSRPGRFVPSWRGSREHITNAQHITH